MYLVQDIAPRRLQCLDLCLNAGADPNQKIHGEPVWWRALPVQELHLAVADRFAACEGFDVNARRKGDLDTALTHWTPGYAYDLHYRRVKWLLDHGADPNARNALQQTPLIRLLRARPWRRDFIFFAPDALGLMIERGADPNLEDPEGLTALDWAAMSGMPDVVEWLAHHEKVNRKHPKFPRWSPDPKYNEKERFVMAITAPWICLLGGRLDVPAGYTDRDRLKQALKFLGGRNDKNSVHGRIVTTMAWWMQRGSKEIPDEWFPGDSHNPVGRIREHCWAVYAKHGVPGRNAGPRASLTRFEAFAAYHGSLMLWYLDAARHLGWIDSASFRHYRDIYALCLTIHFRDWESFADAFELGYRIYYPELIWRFETICGLLRNSEDPNNPWGRAVPWMPTIEEVEPPPSSQ